LTVSEIIDNDSIFRLDRLYGCPVAGKADTKANLKALSIIVFGIAWSIASAAAWHLPFFQLRNKFEMFRFTLKKLKGVGSFVPKKQQ